MKPRLGSAPIFVQVLALALLSVIAAQAINLAIVLWLPDPPPAGVSISEASRALKGASVTAKDGKRLRVSIQSGPPILGHGPAPRDPLNPFVAQMLAHDLGVSSDRVIVALDRGQMKVRHTIRATHVSHQADLGSGRDVTEHEQVMVTVTPDDAPHGRPHDLPAPILERMSAMGANMDFPPFAAAYRRDDGRWAVLEPARPLLSPWQVRLLLGFGATALLLIPFAWWTARRLARPIHLFASAADRLGRDPHAPPLPPGGPAEVRTAVAAFNDMQTKLRRYVDDRTALIAAIAHDLRTPLMRLRFRIEAAPEDIRTRTVADIEQMDAMISAALGFARGENAQAERVKLDLDALVASVVDDMADTGTDVGFDGGKALLIDGDALGLKRLIANLVVNAVKFGGRARVGLRRDKAEAVLTVDDDGPGLPDDQLERVFDPFYRLDASRNAATGGFGLGLSTARSIARAHGGDVALSNRDGGGLRATVRLPTR